jgi:transaldolase
VYKIRQALVAQAAGADYVAPYLGRIADGVRATYPEINPSETFDDMTPEE